MSKQLLGTNPATYSPTPFKKKSTSKSKSIEIEKKGGAVKKKKKSAWITHVMKTYKQMKKNNKSATYSTSQL